MFFVFVFFVLGNSASYPLLEYGNIVANIKFYFSNIDCHGNESKLSECKHHGMGFKNCVEGIEEAGVICTSKLAFMLYSWIS